MARENQLPKELIDWATSDDCECELSYETFALCCGKKFLDGIDKWTMPEHGPRFKDLPPDQRDKILKEAYDQDHRFRNSTGKE